MLRELILGIVPSFDIFLATFAYGVSKIKISKSATLIIALTSTVALCIPLIASSYISQFLPEKFCLVLGVTILIAVALSNIFKTYIKSLVKKRKKLNITKFGFVIDVYIDETKADKDLSMVLSSREAVVLAVAVAIDALATGFGAGLATDINIGLLTVMSVVINITAVVSGFLFGARCAECKRDFSWLGGVVLIGLAISRLMK
ncbi:MAG: manganese efflux pump [Oscillospiraceae bacterium]|jgi:putative sporulation protein YtaF|nr:manganese efflux pump [Oscillospiraceae bacterium]